MLPVTSRGQTIGQPKPNRVEVTGLRLSPHTTRHAAPHRAVPVRSLSFDFHLSFMMHLWFGFAHVFYKGVLHGTERMASDMRGARDDAEARARLKPGV
jgi:hypothetical protein